MISPIVGALVGDLFIGNRKAIMLGAILQGIGAFVLCIQIPAALYTGLTLILLGGGLYRPNITAQYGKTYLNKPKLLDAGFTMFYIAANIGSFLGALAVGYFGEKCGFRPGFALAGVCTLLAIVPFYNSRLPEVIESPKDDIPTKSRLYKIIIGFVLLGLFWTIFEYGEMAMTLIQHNFPNPVSNPFLWRTLGSMASVLIIPFSLIAAIFWSRYYSRHGVKLAIGFITGAFAIGLVLFMPTLPVNEQMILLICAVLLLTISQVYMSPILHSLLTRYVNPKYLAISISLIFVPTWLLRLGIGLTSLNLVEDNNLLLKIGAGLFLVLGISTIIAIYMTSNKPVSEE
jgi:proton-dependent oligopeptide transporter, POT family